MRRDDSVGQRRPSTAARVMSSARQRQLRRERQQVDRRRAAREPIARETQRQQAQAALQADLQRQHRRHLIAYAMFALAAVIAVGHFFEHWGAVELMAPALQDLLIGWPMAGLLAVSGAMIYGK